MSKIKSIDIYNFRCYEVERYEFKDNINIIVGNNASGKTSLVEAICLLLSCKSFRNANDSDMIMHNKDFYSVSGKIKNEISHDVSIIYSKEGKKVSKDGQIYKNLSDFIGEFCVVAFSPDDLKLVIGEPKFRRKFLDMSISQIDKTYLENVIEYNKLLKERNEFLKSVENGIINDNQKTMLLTLSQMLVARGKEIISKRSWFINKINMYLCKYVSGISNNNEEGNVKYNPNCNLEEYEKEMMSREKYDLMLGNTSCGPHKDDFTLFVNGKEAVSFGSQGQKKTMALSIKLSLCRLFDESSKDAIIILDDVFGELDKDRQKYLVEVLDKEKQIFITTTSIDNISEEVCEDYNIIKIKK